MGTSLKIERVNMPHYTNAVRDEVRWLDSVAEEAQWLPEGFTQITDAEADAIRASIVDSIRNAWSYAKKRELEYPLIVDYLDGVVKGDQTQIDKYIADCLAVKAKYPKT